MPDINILKYDIESKVIEGKTYIYDFLRKKYIYLTPEEMVRQKFLRFLIEELNYPKSLCKVEGGLKVRQMNKRTDILWYGPDGLPYLLVECKSFKIKLQQSAFDQLANYNQKIKSKYIGITNGLSHHFCQVDYQNNNLIYLDNIPEYGVSAV